MSVCAALAEVVARRPEIEVAVVFGSAASNRLRPDSDVDLYVRLHRGTHFPPAQRLALVRDAAQACGREVDLVVEGSSTSVILRREVAAGGRPIFESRPGAWTELRVDAMLAYADLEPWLRRIGDSIRATVRRRG